MHDKTKLVLRLMFTINKVNEAYIIISQKLMFQGNEAEGKLEQRTKGTIYSNSAMLATLFRNRTFFFLEPGRHLAGMDTR